MSWKHATHGHVEGAHGVRGRDAGKVTFADEQCVLYSAPTVARNIDFVVAVDSRTGQSAPAKEQSPTDVHRFVRVQLWRRRVLQKRGAQMRGLMGRDAESGSLAMLDTAGVVVSWYDGTGDGSERAGDHVLDRHVSQFYIPEDVAGKQPWRDLQVAVVEGSNTREGWQRRPDGSIFWGMTVIKALTLRDGRLQGFSYMTSASQGPLANLPVAQSLDLPPDAPNEHSLPGARNLPTWDRMARRRSTTRQRRLFRLACRLRVPQRALSDPLCPAPAQTKMRRLAG